MPYYPPPSTGGGGNAFGTIAVSGQSDVVADAAPDTVTLVAGSGVTITTNAGTDTVTLTAAPAAAVAGTATLDFGAAPGGHIATATVTGQTGILSGSHVDAFLMGSDSTADNNDYAHAIAPIKVRCVSITAGTGFTLQGTSDDVLTGTFTVHWVWSN